MKFDTTKEKQGKSMQLIKTTGCRETERKKRWWEKVYYVQVDQS